jgi:hypothetical protein
MSCTSSINSYRISKHGNFVNGFFIWCALDKHGILEEGGESRERYGVRRVVLGDRAGGLLL